MENSPSVPAAPAPAAAPRLLDRKGQVYEPAVSSRLKPLLALIFVGFALLGATGAYMVALRALNWYSSPVDYTSVISLWIILIHLVGGALLVLPFFVFGFVHWSTARFRKNTRAIKLGKWLFFAGAIVCLSGLALVQVHERIQLPTGTITRWVVYALHVAAPVAAVVVYVLHRRAGPEINWRWGYGWGASVAVFVGAMVIMHYQDPRQWYLSAPKQGDKYFHPSSTRTAGGYFVSADTFMMDEYCMKCHEDIYNDHLHSAHKFSSFNNPAYLFAVRETRKVALERDGNTQASRWCAGCHDPVPFLSGKFDDPKFDDVNDPTAHAGVTCTVCHAMTHINSATGNGDYVIEEPQHYPFAASDNPVLQWLNNQMVKAKPDFHKKTFLKPFHKTAEFCSTCHKVSLPIELNNYKEFLRGQNHHDSYLLSGVSGVGTRSFYSPPQAKTNCAQCHMPLKESNDFGAKDFDGSGTRKIHNHLFPAANTGLPWMLSLQKERGPEEQKAFQEAALVHADFLRGTDPNGKDKKLRIDLFGIKEGGTIGGKLTVLRPELPELKPGETYLVEVVIRTLALGHPFTQGTVDSNEIWVDFEARQGKKVFGRSGGLKDLPGTGETDPLPGRDYVRLDNRPLDEWAHRINVLMLDRHGNRINRRNPQDIFTPLYNHQIPPGAGQVVHYSLTVPKEDELQKGADGKPLPITLKVRLRYRKFDYEYMALVFGNAKVEKKPDGREVTVIGDEYHKVPKLPVVDLCEDSVELAVAGGVAVKPRQSPIKPEWQRWNDYGIGCYLEGGAGKKKGELAQAMEAFQKVAAHGEKVAKIHGLINQARVAFDLGYLDQVVNLLKQVPDDPDLTPWWTVAWLTAKVNAQNGELLAAAADLEKVLDPKNQPRHRKFDFRRDYIIINQLGDVYYELSKRFANQTDQRDHHLVNAIRQYERTLEIDSENLDAHFGLKECYRRLGESFVNAKRAKPDKEATVAALAAVLADASQPRERRIEAALQAGDLLTALCEETYPVQTKRPACEEARRHARKVFQEEHDLKLRLAAAHLLGQAHRELHAIFKPDDLAAARARQLFRNRPENEAADHASQAIVIYPLHREGAPGLK